MDLQMLAGLQGFWGDCFCILGIDTQALALLGKVNVKWRICQSVVQTARQMTHFSVYRDIPDGTDLPSASSYTIAGLLEISGWEDSGSGRLA